MTVQPVSSTDFMVLITGRFSAMPVMRIREKGVAPMNSKTLMYILKRIALAVLTVWVVITVTFFVMRAVPGGPFMSEKAISETAQAALEAKYGLDKPVSEQYFTYLRDIVTKFDFGPSLKLRGRDVIDIIDPFRAAANAISIPPGEYDRKVETQRN